MPQTSAPLTIIFLLCGILPTTETSETTCLPPSQLIESSTSALPGKTICFRSFFCILAQMHNEQDGNRNEWAQITQGDYLQSSQQQTYVPEGYAQVQGYAPVEGYFPVHGYAPAGSQDNYSDSLNSTRSPYSAYQGQELNAYAIDEDEVRDIVPSRRQERNSKSPKEDQLKSKRTLRREKVVAEHGAVSATDQPKGLVEWHEGELFWWDPEDTIMRKAAYHDEYRDEFIAQDEDSEGTYVVAPERGKGANDITSACSAYNQLFWRLKDRDSWGNVVDAKGNKVLYLLERPMNQSYFDVPERLWVHEGYVLLDGDNNPVRPWAGIPRCFSSKIEGGRIEALRRILPMTIQDFRARMLRKVPTEAGIGAPTKSLSLPSTFGHRASRFRALMQCPALTPRAGSEVLKKHVTDLLPEGEEATTTEGLQVLTKYEVERRKLSTRGQHLYKGTGRSLTVDERKERDRKLDARLARQAARQPRTPQRLQSMPATPGESASSSPYLPTPPVSAGNKRCREDDPLEYVNFGQSEPAAKRGRHGASPLDPRLQSPLPTPSSPHEDQYHREPSTYDASGTVGPEKVFHEPPLQQLDSPKTEETASTDDSEPDYRFMKPQSLLDQLRIQAALFYPRAHYYAWVGEHPPHTSEGTYIDQYFQIVALLEQKWLLPGGAPSLADIGPWMGSFNSVPRPTLPDEVVRMILHPIAGADPPPASETLSVDHHDAQEGTTADSNSSAENVQTVPSSVMAEVENEGGVNGWSDDLFAEDLENNDGNEDII